MYRYIIMTNVNNYNNIEDYFKNNEHLSEREKVIDFLVQLRQISGSQVKGLNDYNVFMTITYRPDNLKARTPKGQFYETIKFLILTLNKFCDYCLVPEFQLNGNIHYHILLNILDKNAYQLQLRRLRKQCGRLDVQYIKNIKSVTEYLFKDVKNNNLLLDYSFPIYKTSGVNSKTSERSGI